MIFKHILSLLVLCVCALATEFLPPTEAFKLSVDNQTHASIFKIKLAPKVYLYQDKIHAYLNSQEITSSLELPAASEHDNELVYFNELSFMLPAFMADGKLSLEFQGCSEDGLCYQPQSALFKSTNKAWHLEKIEQISQEDEGVKSNSESRFVDSLSSAGFFANIALFAGFGVLLSLTPCVLPMLPILSSILAKKSGSYAFISCLVYVLAMALTYALAGVAAALAGGSLAAIFQQTWVQLIFAALFVALALSSFGVYELALPASWQRFASFGNKKGGLVGAFIMGALSALLVGPCVAAPLAGALIYIASSNDVFLGASALFSMAIGMGVPLIVLGAGFSLIKSGPWMMLVNKFFGFVLLAVAVYFASVAMPKMLSFVLYALILCGFAVEFRLLVFKDFKFSIIKVLLNVLLIACFALLYKQYAPSNKAIEEINFMQAKSEDDLKINVPSLLYFTASWCENCHVYHDEIFPKLSSELKRFKLIKIDLSSPNKFEKQIAQKYQVFGPPVIVKFDKNSQELGKLTGLVSAKELRNFLLN